MPDFSRTPADRPVSVPHEQSLLLRLLRLRISRRVFLVICGLFLASLAADTITKGRFFTWLASFIEDETFRNKVIASIESGQFLDDIQEAISSLYGQVPDITLQEFTNTGIENFNRALQSVFSAIHTYQCLTESETYRGKLVAALELRRCSPMLTRQLLEALETVPDTLTGLILPGPQVHVGENGQSVPLLYFRADVGGQHLEYFEANGEVLPRGGISVDSQGSIEVCTDRELQPRISDHSFPIIAQYAYVVSQATLEADLAAIARASMTLGDVAAAAYYYDSAIVTFTSANGEKRTFIISGYSYIFEGQVVTEITEEGEERSGVQQALSILSLVSFCEQFAAAQGLGAWTMALPDPPFSMPRVLIPGYTASSISDRPITSNMGPIQYDQVSNAPYCPALGFGYYYIQPRQYPLPPVVILCDKPE